MKAVTSRGKGERARLRSVTGLLSESLRFVQEFDAKRQENGRDAREPGQKEYETGKKLKEFTMGIQTLGKGENSKSQTAGGGGRGI